MADAFKRAQTLDKAKVREPHCSTNLNTIVGPVKFNGSKLLQDPAGRRPMGEGKEVAWEIIVTYDKEHPEIPTQGKTVAIHA